MMKINPIQLHFFPKKKTNNSIHSLYMRMQIGSERCDISLKYELSKESWDKSNQRLKPKHRDQTRVSVLMNEYRHRAHAIYQESIQLGKSPSVFDVRNELLGIPEEGVSASCIFEMYRKAIDRKRALAGENNSAATIQKYGRTKGHLENFVKATFNKSIFPCEDITLKFIEDFEVYLKNRGNCQHNSAMKHIQTFRTIFKMAIAHGYVKNDPFANYKIRLQEVVRDCLNQDEINRIESVELSNKKLMRVRDFFLFSCYTGLAYAEIYNLKAKNIQLENGQYWIRTRRLKTNVITNVPLLEKPKAILLNYNSKLHELADNDLVFPILSNQKTNDYLKIIALHCGITKNLHFHLARHSFATTVLLTNGVPIESVSSMLGHKRIATTQHYAKMVDKKLEEDMQKLQSRLSALNGK
jgi:site-specific recombinase XerD